MKLRRILYRLVGSVVAILGFGLILKFYYSTVMISVGTVILICGVAIWMAATPEDYNRADGVVKMITFGDTIRKIEDFYEAFKNVPTPLGSGYLGRFYTMKQPGLIFGPDEYGNYLYFWITNSGINGYLGYSDIPGFIKSRITEPLIPPKKDFADNTADYVCYHSDVILLQKYLFESISPMQGPAKSFRSRNPSRQKYTPLRKTSNWQASISTCVTRTAIWSTPSMERLRS